MKKAFVLLLPVFLIPFLLSCSQNDKKTYLVQENATSIPLPLSGNNSSFIDKSKWVTAPTDVNTHYVKLDDVNTHCISEITLDEKLDLNTGIIGETTDGFLWGSADGQKSIIEAGTQKTNPIIRKFDKKGKEIWSKSYDYKTYSGRVNNLFIYPDDSYIFTLQTSPYYINNEMLTEKSMIVKCDNKGNVVWTREFEDFNGTLLKSLIVSVDGEVFIVGEWRGYGGKQTKDYESCDIVIIKLDTMGNIIKQKSFGGKGFDYLYMTEYDESIGIVISGNTLSADGEFASKRVSSSIDFIACIDKNLSLKWVLHSDIEETFAYDQLALSHSNIYITGNYKKMGESPLEGFIIKADANGKRVWTKPYKCLGLWSQSIAILDNGDIIAGSGQQNQGIMVLIDQMGNEKKRLENLRFAPGKIIPTEDGGFITTSCREIKPVPQPPQISCIWYDTELLISKYSSGFELEWRKTYDRYKNERTSDFAQPLRNGQIILGTP